MADASHPSRRTFITGSLLAGTTLIGDALAQTSPAPSHTPARSARRFLLDSDGTNIFMQRTLSDDDYRWVAQQCPRSVTTYLICPNWCGKFTYPCKVGELVPQTLAPALVAAIQRGEDPLGKVLGYLKQAGKEVFITYRMNDVHDASDPNAPATADFKKKHPRLIVDPSAVGNKSSDWMNYCLDYSHPEVQAYILSSLKDLADRYDINGIQLDWMRFPRHLSGTTAGQAWSKRQHLTEFTASVRTMLDEVGSRRGKRILLAARVPTSPQGCKYLGVDVADWAARKLVDFITLCPFLSCDTLMPIQDFRDLLKDHPIPIYAGTDFGHSGRPHSLESYRGWAMTMYDQNPDGLYIFNFPCWTEYVAEQPCEWITDLDDPAKLLRKPALYTLVSNHHRVGGVDLPTPLPASIGVGKGIDLSIRVPKAALPASRAKLLIASGADVQPSFNGTRLSPHWKATSGNLFPAYVEADALKREPAADQCRLYLIPPSLLKPGINTLTLTNPASADTTVTRVDLGLWYSAGES